MFPRIFAISFVSSCNILAVSQCIAIFFITLMNRMKFGLCSYHRNNWKLLTITYNCIIRNINLNYTCTFHISIHPFGALNHILRFVTDSLHLLLGPLPGLGPLVSMQEEPPSPLPRVKLDVVLLLLPATHRAARRTKSNKTVARSSHVRVEYTSTEPERGVACVEVAMVVVLILPNFGKRFSQNCAALSL